MPGKSAVSENDQGNPVDPDTETEKREEPKSSIVPFPTRGPAAPSHPDPTGRSGEPSRPSVHEIEAAHPAAGTPEFEKVETGLVGAGPTRGPLPKQTDAEQAGDVAAAPGPIARPSMHAAEAVAAEQEKEQAPRGKTAGKAAAKRTDPKRAAESNRPLTRAQDRLSGATVGSQSSSAGGRKVPAAWLKAAASIAARAVTQPTPGQPTSDVPESGQPTTDQQMSGDAGSGQVESGDAGSGQVESGHAGSGQVESGQTQPGETAAARKSRPRTTPARPAAEKAAAKITPRKPPAEKPAQPAKRSPRTPSYREEAAELLASAAGERKRRSTATPRPSTRTRPKEAPDES
jgi:hypothetical protein